ncbi:hypothetical protein [Cohnella yongneupensis]|uniref:Uncharacterized protein n=1 Tax=Cohnella yongneupensis TaxID=425006 RepID=A0ABW0QZZ7_9BACL
MNFTLPGGRAFSTTRVPSAIVIAYALFAHPSVSSVDELSGCPNALNTAAFNCSSVIFDL